MCPDLVALRVEMQEGAGAILVTEDLLRAEAVAELGELFAGQLPWSDLPLLIFSAGRERQNGPLEELKKLAPYTLIDRPTRKKTLISAVQTALRARRRQYEVRDLLIELEKSVRSRDQFLAMLSHELRNPLAAILTSSQLMERRDPSVFVSERGIVQRQTRLLARLVDDLLDVSRVTLGKIALAPGPVDMGALLERCVKSWMPAAADLGVSLTLGSGARFVRRRRRSGAPRADHVEPALERREVHAPGRPRGRSPPKSRRTPAASASPTTASASTRRLFRASSSSSRRTTRRSTARAGASAWA